MAGTEVPLWPAVPPDRPLAVRVAMLERLVLEMAKHVYPAGPPPDPSFSLILEELKLRHPDV